MKLKIQTLHPSAKVPCYATDGAACFDLHAVIETEDGLEEIFPGQWLKVRTGLAFETPEGHMLQIRSRSGLAFKQGITAFHGTVDSDFTGEVIVLLHNGGRSTALLVNGDRIAQAAIVSCPKVEFEVVEQLSLTERGNGGFGSTGV